MKTRTIVQLLPYAMLGMLTVGCGDVSNGQSVTGTWNLYDATSGLLASEFTFADDGTFTVVDYDAGAPIGQASGDYTISGDLMTMVGTDAQTGTTDQVEWTFYRSGDRLGLGAFLPEGNVDGYVGTWSRVFRVTTTASGASTSTVAGGDEEIRFNNDGTVSGSLYLLPDELSQVQGNYEEVAPGQVLAVFPLPAVTIGYLLTNIDDGALSGGVLERN